MAIVDELIAVLGFDLEGEANAQRFQSTLDRVDKRMQSFTRGVAKYGSIVGAALGTVFAATGKSVISTSAEFEGFQAALETIEGSADKARDSLDWISNFGKTTPYDVAGVTDAFIKLKAYGIDPIANDALRVLGDTASAMNKPLNQAVEAFADAANGEFERLKEFGITSKTVGDEVTFSWTRNGKLMSETVKKNSEDIRRFLLENMGERFNGAMLRQSKTWNGMMSNLGDSWTDFQRRIGEGGFFDTVKGYLGDLLDWFNELDANGTIDRWSQNLSNAFTFVAETIKTVVDRISTHFKFLNENFDGLGGKLKWLGFAFAFMIARAFPVITVFSFLALVVDDFLTYLEGGESIIGSFIDKLQEIFGVSEGVAQAIAGMSGSVAAALAFGFLFAPIRTLKMFSRLFVGGLRRLIPVVGKAGWAIARSFGGLVIRGLVMLAPLILKGAAAAFALLSNPIGWAVLIGGAAIGLIYYFWDEIVAAWNTLVDKVGPLFSSLGTWIMDNIPLILAGPGVALIAYFWDDLSAAFNNLYDKVVELFSQIGQWILDIDWSAIGVGLMNALWDGMKTIGDSIKSWFTSLVPDWAKDWIGGDAEVPEQISSGASNLQGNSGRVNPRTGIAYANQQLNDRRDQSVVNNVTVNQTVTQATDAPAAAASATGNAVGSASVAQRSQIEAEPLMP